MILKHWQEKDLGTKEDENMTEQSKLLFRRLYRILMMPVVDVLHPNPDEKPGLKPLGFRSVMNKSVRGKEHQGEIRNTLLKLAHMCPENDIKSFVEN